MYCKGNAEIYIHCIYHPKHFYRLELEDGIFISKFVNILVFVCFLDMAPNYEAKGFEMKTN